MTFGERYAEAFGAYLAAPGEAGLGAAYDLGRDAVADGLSLLDLATIHHEALLAALGRAPDAGGVVTAAADFFCEGLSAFEMLQRGVAEARETAAAEKRQTTMLRQLSGFLADASLAIGGPDALDEVLHLVAEHARELTAAGWCVATLAVGGDERLAAVAAASPEAAVTVEPQSVAKLLPPPSEPVAERRGGAALAAEPRAAALARLFGLDRPPGGSLAVPLVALDGRELGWIQLYDRDAGAFRDVDEATVLHLAQMAAAAVERVRLYAR